MSKKVAIAGGTAAAILQPVIHRLCLGRLASQKQVPGQRHHSRSQALLLGCS
ncbi:hypothetical protein AM1_6102 [Acaryochloris marina MBIC11017]|uniref:Uncharacterized protein n=1 Tax=Acaryochloris marina (strain MBIC 11017) TaxID=329726 RepID=B0C3U7_ACAM1|nr:hypothetical protein AM1_6102 [Acaryochloris marina MBIC11017]